MSEEDRIKLESEIKKDLQTNPLYREFFGKFKTDSDREFFIERYTREKTSHLNYGKTYYEYKQKWNEGVKDTASSYLEIILQKKLFDKQCLWRAEKIKIAEVKLCADFGFWEKNIVNCPFIDPITEDEYKVLRTFICEKIDFACDLRGAQWQEYPEPLFGLFEDDKETPLREWYSFYNQSMRSPNYGMIYNDVRSEKESAYETRQPMPEDFRAIFNFGDDDASKTKPWNLLPVFMERFENKQIKEYYSAYQRHSARENFDNLYEEALRIIRYSYEDLSIGDNEDWFNGLLDVANDFWKKVLLEHLDKIFHDYQNGIPLNKPDDKDFSFHKNLMDKEHERIINVRISRGEPGNLDF